jgi:hypothetical protein
MVTRLPEQERGQTLRLPWSRRKTNIRDLRQWVNQPNLPLPQAALVMAAYVLDCDGHFDVSAFFEVHFLAIFIR